MPATVSFTATGTTAMFRISTTVVAYSTPVTISASLGASTKSATVTVRGVTLTAITDSGLSHVQGGTNFNADVMLSAVVPTNAAVSVSSSDTSVATVPNPVTVLAHTASRVFTVVTKGVSSDKAVTISANFGGIVRTLTVTVTPPAVALSMLSDSGVKSVKGGQPLTAAVTLTGTAPSAVSVTISSSDANVAAVPNPVVVSAGAQVKTFTVTTKAVTANTSITIKGVYNGIARTLTFTVTP